MKSIIHHSFDGFIHEINRIHRREETDRGCAYVHTYINEEPLPNDRLKVGSGIIVVWDPEETHQSLRAVRMVVEEVEIKAKDRWLIGKSGISGTVAERVRQAAICTHGAISKAGIHATDGLFLEDNLREEIWKIASSQNLWNIEAQDDSNPYNRELTCKDQA